MNRYILFWPILFSDFWLVFEEFSSFRYSTFVNKTRNFVSRNTLYLLWDFTCICTSLPNFLFLQRWFTSKSVRAYYSLHTLRFGDTISRYIMGQIAQTPTHWAIFALIVYPIRQFFHSHNITIGFCYRYTFFSSNECAEVNKLPYSVFQKCLL